MELDFSEQIKAKWSDGSLCKAGVCKDGVHTPTNKAAKAPHNAQEEAKEPKNHNEKMENEAAEHNLLQPKEPVKKAGDPSPKQDVKTPDGKPLAGIKAKDMGIPH